MKPYRQLFNMYGNILENIRDAIAIAKIVETSDEVNSIVSILRRYSNEMRAY